MFVKHLYQRKIAKIAHCTTQFLGQIICVLGLGLSACGGGGGEVATSGTETQSPTSTIVKPQTPVVILVFGDSLSSGWGLGADKDWVSLLRKKVGDTGLDANAPVTVVNESVAGEFAIGAVSRLPEALARVKPTHVLLAHGTNDARTSLPWSMVSDAMGTMIELSKSAGAKPLLLDITLTSYGPEVAAQYTATFKETARLHAVPYVGVVENLVFKPEYYDPIIPFHLTESAQPFMMENVWAVLLTTFP